MLDLGTPLIEISDHEFEAAFSTDDLDSGDLVQSEAAPIYAESLEQMVMLVWEHINKPTFRLSYSSISELLKSPLDFFKYIGRRFTHPDKLPKISDAMLLGMAIDSYVFRKLVSNTWEYLPQDKPMNRTTKEGKAAYAELQAEAAANGKKVLPLAVWEKVQIMGKAFEVNEILRGWCLEWANRIQYKVSGKIDGFDIVGVIDAMGSSQHSPQLRAARGSWYLCDLKSMPSADDRYLKYEIPKRGLHLQQWIYNKLLHQQLGVEIDTNLVAVLTATGHANVKRLTADQLQEAARMFRKAISVFEAILTSNRPESLLLSYVHKDGFSYL